MSLSQKVDAIYSALDSGDYRTATKLCQRPDIAHHQITRSLLSYCLAAQRQMAEALTIARGVVAETPVDESVLNTLSHTFKMCRAENDLAQCYENALNVMPTNEGFMIELFFVYNRMREPKKMQLLAQKLFKLNGKPMFLFWSVSSMLQQPDLPPAMLTVAERMLQKVFNESKTKVQPGAEELELYISIITRQGRIKEALATLDELIARDVGLKINDESQFTTNADMVKMHNLRKFTLRVELLDRLVRETDGEERLSYGRELIAELKKLLEAYPDQWDAHQQLIDSVLKYQSGGSAAAVIAHREYISGIQSKHPRLRGPYLAEMLLLVTGCSGIKDLNERQPLDDVALPGGWKASAGSTGFSGEDVQGKHSVAGELSRLLTKFIDRFQTKQCCYSDIKPYISLLARGDATVPVAITTLRRWVASRKDDEERKVQAVEVPIAEAEEAKDEAADAVAAITGETSTSSNSKKKKNKKGKPKAQEPAAAAEPRSTLPIPIPTLGDTPADRARAQAVELLCSCSKLGQIQLFCDVLMGGSSSTTEGGATATASASASGGSSSYLAPQPHLVTLFQSTKSLCVGSIGGDREVQPGDELLLICSAAHRLEYTKLPLALQFEDSDHVGYARKLLRAGRWANLLQLGAEASPYTYTFKLEILEPFRELCIGEAALVMFTGLGAKYVQNDSMPYLILPALLESGLYGAARLQHRAVCGFHLSAKRDTADMMSKCYQHANYVKAAELLKFIEKCKISSQLALSKAELPLMEITENYHTAEDAKDYIKSYLADQLGESQPLLDDAALSALEDHMDYELLARADCTDSEDRSARLIRRKQLESRIKVSQRVLWLLDSTLRGDVEAGKEHLDSLKAYIAAQHGIRNDVSTSTSSMPLNCDSRSLLSRLSQLQVSPSTSSASVRAGAGKGYFQWDQHIDGGGIAAETAIWNTFTAAMNYFLTCIESLKDEAKLPDLSTSADAYLQAVDALRNILVFDNSADLPRFLPAPSLFDIPEEKKKLFQNLPLSPNWLRAASMFTRTLSSWLPIAAQAVTLHTTAAPQPPANATSVDETTPPAPPAQAAPSPESVAKVTETIKSTATAFTGLVSDLMQVLEGRTDEDVFSGDAAAAFFEAWSSQEHLPGAEGTGISSGVQRALADQLASGQSHSCSLLRDYLNRKLNTLKSLC